MVTPYHANDNASLYLGDCLEVLATMPANSVDSVVTDPPAGISFMGKDWDGDKGGRDSWVAWMAGVMRECLRVLRPGGHALVWALPRTSHWTTTALEDAGFEIRDVVTHHFGTGFPKSLDVSKAIDKAAGAERKVIGLDAAKAKQQTRAIGTAAYGDYAGNSGAITAPSTDAAKQWNGWGTALKPASEHWVLVRKPLIGTVAANVQTHGTGAINVNGCRVETPEVRPKNSIQKAHDEFGTFKENGGRERSTGSGANHTAGRWPANLILSHSEDCAETCTEGCPVREMDAQSGELKTHGGGSYYGPGSGFTVGGRLSGDATRGRGAGNSGGASRFFYCAKPSKAEKGATNAHPTVKSIALMTYLIKLITPPGGTVLDPFAGSGTTGVAAIRGGWNFIGIERDNDYVDIACARMAK